MRREELVMDILGGLDDSFIEEAMPRTGKYAVSDSAVAAAPITLVETGTEISKKDLRIYWITRALGMAAVVALIVGAVVLLVQNWDKIAVSGNERPGVVTSVTNGTVTPDITEIDTIDRFEQITDTSMPEPYPYNDHEYYKDFYYTWINRFSEVSGNLIDLPDMEKQIDLINYYTLNRAETPYTLDDNLNLYSWMTRLDLSVDDVCRAIEENNEYYQTLTLNNAQDMVYNPYEIDVLKSGDRSRIAEAFATEYSIIIGDKVFNPEWLYYHTIEDYSAVGITPEEVLHKLDMYEGLGLTDEAWAAFSAKLQEYADTADSFGQITDTSMPDLLTGKYDDDSYDNFLFAWKFEMRGIPIELMRLVDQSVTDKWFGEMRPIDDGTPYRIDRGCNLYNYITSMGISWNDAAPILERYFSADEIKAMRSGDIEKITQNAASEYSIVIGDNAYSPKWLYYHTTEDYEAAGITDHMIGQKLMNYKNLGIPDEMWRAFRKKLVMYCTEGIYDESGVSATYLIEADRYEPFDDRAFGILEDRFYGEWELDGELDGFDPTLSFTYEKDPFVHEGTPVNGIYETDEIYVVLFSNYGVGSCYIIEKSTPDIMYRTEVLSSGVDLEVIKLFKDIRYINRKAETPALKVGGKISPLGLKYLLHIFGGSFSDFEEYFDERMEQDRNGNMPFEDPTGTNYLGDAYTVGNAPWYLAEFRDDTFTLVLPYVKNKSGLKQTPEYFSVRFEQDLGGWTARYDRYFDIDGDIPQRTFTSSAMERYVASVTLTDVTQSGSQLSYQIGKVQLTDTMNETAVVGEADISLPHTYDSIAVTSNISVHCDSLSDGRIIVSVRFPLMITSGVYNELVSMYCYDGTGLRMLRYADDKEFCAISVAKDDVIIDGDRLIIIDGSAPVDENGRAPDIYTVDKDGVHVTKVN